MIGACGPGAACVRSIRAFEHEVQLTVRQGESRREVDHRYLRTPAERGAIQLDGIRARAAPDCHSARAHLDPRLLLVDLRGGAGEPDEPWRRTSVGAAHLRSSNRYCRAM